MNHTIQTYLQEDIQRIQKLSLDIFHCAELAENEVKSAQLMADYLREHNFQVELGIGGMPTSIRGIWGSGTPCIGFLGEYDALPQLDQPPQPYYCGNPEKNGHGCGHNLLGVGSAAAAVALTKALAAGHLSGTIIYYGCPAEEILKGKVTMISHGCFTELDTALSWHPGMENNCGELSYLAIDSIQFFFQGKSAHASAAPHKGRSALDACELMNVGVNYLREHVPENVRMHYSYLLGDMAPNIVPAQAGVWYFIRGQKRETVDDVMGRVLDIARGAALMTSTEVTWKFLSRGYDTLVNMSMCGLIHRVMTELGAPEFTKDEKDFIQALGAQISSESDVLMDETIAPLTGAVTYMTGSTDISDVSQLIPTGYFRAACGPKGSALHTWQYTACAGHAVGERGMAFAAQVLAETGLELIANPDAIKNVKKEFQQKSKGYSALV